MEALIPILSFFGIFVGILISKYTREDIRSNRNYHMVLSKIIIGILILVIILFADNLSLLFTGVLLGFLSAYVSSEFLFLGFVLGISFFLKKDISLITSSLVFMYSLVYGSLLRVSSLNFSKILILFIMFFLPFSVFLFDNIVLLDLIIGFVAGGLSKYLIGNKFLLA